MQEENEYPQEEVVVEEEVTTTEEAEESNDDTVTLTKSEYSKLKRQAIAYKANKSEKPERETPTTTNSLTKQEIQEEILIAKGIDPQLLEEMKALATLRGKTLLQMENDPIILAMKETKEAEAAKAKARLGASRGSTSVKAQKTTTTPNLSDEDHKAMWREHNSK